MRHFLFAVLIAAAGCGEPPSKPSNASPNNASPNNAMAGGDCAQDTDCVRGQVCGADDVCVTVSCEFCTADQVCYRPTVDAAGSCSSDDTPVVTFNSTANNEPDPTTNNAQTTCDSRADCSSNQECRDSLCVDHFACDLAEGGGNGAGCEYLWRCESDGKDYRMICELLGDSSTVACLCLVNDVAMMEFEDDAVAACEFDTAYRAANDNCGWSVPAP